MKKIFYVLCIMVLFSPRFSFSQQGSISDSARSAVQSRIDSINQKIKEKGYQWTAGVTPLSYLSWSEKKKLCGVHTDSVILHMLMQKEDSVYKEYKTSAMKKEGVSNILTIPNWLSYQSRVTNQGSCGDCWAHAAAGVADCALQYYLGSVPPDPGIEIDPTYISNNATCASGCSGTLAT